ncbi:MAG: hypothetical protein H0U77_05885 [Nocardioidaceae bacterium]|nr:hypothetical protein [Nocardioidaceae bacterium]
MRTAIIGGGIATLFTVSSLVLAAPAAAEERTCRGSIGATTLDNVRVPQGATCRLEGTTVQGTIKIENNARLYATDIRVIGNIQGEGHRRVDVQRSRVGGSIQLVQGEAALLRNNNVGQDVQSFENSATQRFTLNRINGNLQCKENTPKPTGGQNTVGGNKEDQCANL